MKREILANLFKDDFEENGAILYKNLVKNGQKCEESVVDTGIWSSTKVYTPNGNFYLAPEGVTEREIVDGEILTSYVYNKLGFNEAPLYFPVIKGGKLTVMCDDIDRGRMERASTFDKKVSKILKINEDEVNHIFSNPDNLTALQKTYFTGESIKQRLKLSLLDAVLGVPNRDVNQIMYSVSKAGQVTDITPLTGGMSGLNYLRQKQKKWGNPAFRSEFTTKFQEQTSLLQSFANCDDAREFLNDIELHKFILQLMELDYVKVAREIKDDMNYEIDPKYIKYMQDNKEKFLDEIQTEMYKDNSKKSDMETAFSTISSRKNTKRVDTNIEQAK